MLFCLFSFIVVYSRRLSLKMLFGKKSINDEGRIYRKERYPLSRSHSS